jgi:hypothetical protein
MRFYLALATILLISPRIFPGSLRGPCGDGVNKIKQKENKIKIVNKFYFSKASHWRISFKDLWW